MSATPILRLTAGARVIRGAKRIGFLIGALLLAAGFLAGIGAGYSEANYKVAGYHQAKCMMANTSANLLVSEIDKGGHHYLFAENGCPGPGYSATEAQIRATGTGPIPSFAGIMFGYFWPWMLMGVVAAASAFGLCWGLGWVAAGFTAD